MSDKYIIRNCPCYFEENEEVNDYTCAWNGTEELACQDCINCAKKRVVEKCKKEIRVYRNTLLPNDGTNTLHFGRQSFAYDILKLLDIQEDK